MQSNIWNTRRHIPKIVVSDDGPRFSSRDFTKFVEKYGFSHSTITLEETERQSELCKRRKTCQRPLHRYASTTWAEFLMGRTKVPSMPSHYFPVNQHPQRFQQVDAMLISNNNRKRSLIVVNIRLILPQIARELY
ncbi:Uncharacterised protein r2_g1999 [Pycnogonum litorale]